MKNILLVFTGGTIGSVSTNGTINTSEATSFTLIQLFQQHFKNHQLIHFDIIQPLQILSENLAPLAWPTLISSIDAAKRQHYDGIIITHGTDTLAYTACALSFYFNKIKIPMFLVSSDYPLANPKANGLENFICAIEFILQIKKPGVFVAYQNKNQITQVHKASHLTCSLQLGGDFFSVQNKSYMQYETRQFQLLSSEQFQSPIENISLKAVFSERILMIRPYPGLDYSRFNLDNIDAVLHDLYHSGTACSSLQWGENYSLIEFIKCCKKRGICVYLAPAIKSADAYLSTQTLIEHGSEIIWNMSLEAAYVKLLLAYGNFVEQANILDFINKNIADEHVS
ncbi:MAG: asparaginase domain-containing protein [Methylobacter sp.]|nr:asparaginase domain-containing protein [Methylobacter sp.]